MLSSIVLLGSRVSPSQSFLHTAWFPDHQYFKLFCPSFTSKNFEKIWFLSCIFFCPLRCFVTTSTAIYYLLVEKTYKSDLFVLCVVAWPPLAVICIDGFFTLPGFMTSSVLESLIKFAWKAEKSLAIGCVVLWPPVLSSIVLLGSRGSSSQRFLQTAWFRDHQYFKLFCPSLTSRSFVKIWFFSYTFFAHCIVLWPLVLQFIICSFQKLLLGFREHCRVLCPPDFSVFSFCGYCFCFSFFLKTLIFCFASRYHYAFDRLRWWYGAWWSAKVFAEGNYKKVDADTDFF